MLNATVDENGQVSQLTNGNITMVGSVLDAKQNIIGFGEDITLTAGTYQDYAYSHTSKSSFGGLKSKSREELAQDALLSGSTLSAGGTISLDAGNNLSILASHLDGDNIGLTAFNEVLIASGEESSIREVRTKSGGFLSGGSLFSSSEALNGVAKITADSSTLNATGNLVIDAGSATVIGSKLNADKGMHISTDIGDINVLAAKETERNYSKEETIKVGFGDVIKSLTKPGELIQTSGGQLTVKLAEASYDKVDFESTAVEQKGSELSAGESLTFNSVAVPFIPFTRYGLINSTGFCLKLSHQPVVTAKKSGHFAGFFYACSYWFAISLYFRRTNAAFYVNAFFALPKKLPLSYSGK